MLTLDQIESLTSQWRARQIERDNRNRIIDAAVAGDFQVFDEDEEQIENRSPNLIQVALEDTAEAASLVPTCRGVPLDETDDARRAASKMERIAVSYLDEAGIETLLVRLAMDQLAYGLHVLTVYPDEDGRPLITRRDPRTFYPDLDWRPQGRVRRGSFVREVQFSQLPDHWAETLRSDIVARIGQDWTPEADLTVTLTEFLDDEVLVVAGTVAGSRIGSGYTLAGSSEPMTVELSRLEHGLGVCPIVTDHRITLDGEYRGQFDQVVGMLYAHIQLMGLMLDYADQSIYADVWVKDLIGDMPFGGGSYIQLGPQGAIGRVPPAVPAFQVNQELQMLIDHMHLASRYPKTRPGEVDQSIASAKFVEATVGTMNTVIRQLHIAFQHSLERCLNVAFMVDKKHGHGKSRKVSGLLRNLEFAEEYEPSKDIKMNRAKVKVEYGLGLGRDPAQSAVLHIQYAAAEFISKEFVQEHIDGLSDIGREQSRIDVEKMESMMLAKLLEGVQTGQVSNGALVEITKARQEGKSLIDVYREFIVEPEEEMLAQQMPTGMGNVMPGDPLGGMMPPDGAVPVPQAPSGNDLLARINSQGADGTMLGAQNTGPV